MKANKIFVEKPIRSLSCPILNAMNFFLQFFIDFYKIKINTKKLIVLCIRFGKGAKRNDLFDTHFSFQSNNFEYILLFIKVYLQFIKAILWLSIVARKTQ